MKMRPLRFDLILQATITEQNRTVLFYSIVFYSCLGFIFFFILLKATTSSSPIFRYYTLVCTSAVHECVKNTKVVSSSL